MRLGTRVAAAHASIVAVLAIAGSWAFLASAERALDSEMTSRTRTVARLAALRVDRGWIPGLTRGDVPLTALCDAALARVAAPAGARLVVLDSSGSLRCASDPSLPKGTRYRGLAVDAFEAAMASAGSGAVSPPWVAEDGAWYQSAYEPLANEGESRGSVVGAELAVAYRAPLERLRRAVIVFTLAGVAAAILAGVWLARGVTRPLSRLESAMTEIGLDGLPQPAGVSGSDEVGMLGRRFDALVDALRRHDAELRELSATVAHEVRNPLGAMTGFAELIERRANASGDTKMVEMTRGIREEVAALERVVARFLSFAGDVRVTKRPSSIAGVIDDAIRAAVPPGSTLRIVKHYAELPDVPVDAELLREVFVNLIRNAAQSTGENGTVTLELASGAGSFVVASVCDDGPGIAPEMRGRLFEPFATTKADGTGLGLAICRRIVAAHGGTLSLREAPKGAAFDIRLPISPAS